MNEPRMSVIIPAWNAAGHIAHALDSLRRQTWQNLEILVCNDGSTDDTGRIVQEDYPEVVYLEQQNAGPAAARNTAIGEATGELLAFLDADDEWTPHYAERMMALFREYPDAGAMSCNATVRCGSHVYPFCLPPGPKLRALTLLDVMRGIRPPGPALVIRANVLRELDGFDTSIVGSEDADLLCRLVVSGHKLIFTSEPFYHKTEHPANLSGLSYSLRAADHLRGFTKMDPRREDLPWPSPLTERQYSWFVVQDLVRGAIACRREGKREVGLGYLDEIRKLPAPSLAARTIASMGRHAWWCFELLGTPYYLYTRTVRAVNIWGVVGFARQMWRRWVA